MNLSRLALIALSLGITALAHAQQPAPSPKPAVAEAPPPVPVLTQFDLDFPGGTPAQLAAAIEKAQNKPFNVVIPAEFADQQLPALKMRGVNTNQLFRAINEASEFQKFQSQRTSSGTVRVQSYGVQFGFKTMENPVTDSSVWYFYSRGLPPPEASEENICRFYPLSPYLDRGLTVDDITTAIQAGWRMSGVAKTPALNFHKETSLLIAVGQRGQLGLIEDVLNALTSVAPAAKAPEAPAKSGS